MHYLSSAVCVTWWLLDRRFWHVWRTENRVCVWECVCVCVCESVPARALMCFSITAQLVLD